MSRQDELLRKGRIAELHEELRRSEALISGMAEAVGQATNTLLGYDRLDPEAIEEATRVLTEAIRRRRELLDEIARLER